MSNVTAVSVFDQGGMPAHLADLNEQSNIVGKDNVPQLSFRGKVWRTVLEGDETVITNNEGDPVQSVNVVILDYSKLRNRKYFRGGYTEGKATPPVCWSKDGILPDPSVQEKQAPACDGCPQSVKGSKMTDSGAQVTACAQYKKMVVVPIAKLDHPRMLLTIPQTSMWDKDNELEKANFFAFDQYMEFLRKKGVNNTALAVTKIKFDPKTAYPKLLFGAVGWLPPEAKAQVALMQAGTPETEALMHMSDTLAAARATTEAPAPQEYAAPAPVAAAPAPAPAAAAPARPAKPNPPPPPAKPAAPAADPDDTPAFGGAHVAAGASSEALRTLTTGTAPAAAAAPVVSTEPAGKGLGSLLQNWDD